MSHDRNINSPALISCRRCTAPISNQAISCPKCGNPNVLQYQSPYNGGARSDSSKFIIGSLIVFVVVLLIGIPAMIILPKVIRDLRVEKTPSELNQSQAISSNPSKTTDSTNNRSSSDYKAGYKKGYAEGRVMIKGDSMPQQIFFDTVGGGEAEKANAKDVEAWKNGWTDGWKDAYRKVKPPKINEDALEHLSWENAKPSVKLYNNVGNHEATILEVDQPNGLITVRYNKDRNSVIEKKLLDAVSNAWFVGKSDK